ncbi:6-bladed beta-propeller protein [Roseivirga ehrenbergii]|uniref:6-bladed beta-propeller n=1 Tax=Roseivirga ehrenbergii (strain DSM 102268 / JCM 13514 / KCTC 12282 / NCIMB 14502 / KMM 6017) TaxID=279360 RepID=A0A150XEA1_ROSEK|nr:6-bladed beta-propeller [Roseivirga ehrenbergii]KYG77079.1 hypothetical protein MB14_02445 [Roseivirga ehrenbergii]TCL14415.1 6-bladed beta-propeller protein [Roseivirga ehrenbergii]
MNKSCFFILLIFSTALKAQNLPKLERFEIDIDAPRTNFFDAIDHIEVIRLEENENSLISSWDSYFKTPNGFGVPNKEGTNFYRSIALFDVKGDYKNVISNYGQGPNEYSNISDAWFSKGRIELYSGWSRLLLRYSEDGEHIETLKAGYDKAINGQEMIPYKNGYLFEPRNPSSPNTVIAYDGFYITDDKLRIMSKGAFINNPKRVPENIEGNISQLEEAVFYSKPLTDTVYQIIDGKEYPRFKFDFGKQWLWSDPTSNVSMNRDIKVMLKGNKVYKVKPGIGKNYIMVSYNLNPMSQRKGMINRKSGKFTRFDMRKNNKEDYDINFLEWEDGRLVGFIAAYDFEEFMDNLDNDQWTVNGGFDLEEIFQSENPVLLKIKFKSK